MLRIMTSNIWGDYFGNEVAFREDQLFETYVKYSPDVLGIQEVTPGWHDSTLMTHMRRAGYRICNSAPHGVNNFNILFVKDSRFEVYRQGFEQLACTEDPSKNIQWAVLKDRENGHTIAVCNTHFEYRGGPRFDHVRELHAEQLSWRMGFLQEHYHCDAVFGFGDMNAPGARPSSPYTQTAAFPICPSWLRRPPPSAPTTAIPSGAMTAASTGKPRIAPSPTPSTTSSAQSDPIAWRLTATSPISPRWMPPITPPFTPI